MGDRTISEKLAGNRRNSLRPSANRLGSGRWLLQSLGYRRDRLRGRFFERVLRDAMDRNRIPGQRAFFAARSRGHLRRQFAVTLAFLLLAFGASAQPPPPA